MTGFYKNIPNVTSSTASKTVIIGAGLAGLTAAYTLQQKGCNVEVFEAKNRVGGRVHSAYVKNLDGDYSIAELGGQNLLDGGGNELLPTLVKNLGLEIIENNFLISPIFYDGQSCHDIMMLLQQYDLTPEVFGKKIDELQKTATSMQDVLDNFFKKKSILHQLFTSHLSAYEGSTPDKLSVYHNIKTFEFFMQLYQKSLNQAEYKNVILHQRIKGGNAMLPLTLARNLRHITLGKVLKEVQLTLDNQLALTFQDQQTVLLDQLILAIPCPIYSDITFGSNVISEERLAIIKQVQYGANGKIMIPIELNNGHYSAVTTKNMGGFSNGDDSKIYNMYFIGESGATLLENADVLFKEGVKAMLATLGKRVSDKKPVLASEEQLKPYDAPVLKSWVEDPFAKGSYSGFGLALGEKFAATTVYKNQRVKSIFEPIADRVFMIGEHTTLLNEIGTMKAAVESGGRVAEFFQK